MRKEIAENFQPSLFLQDTGSPRKSKMDAMDRIEFSSATGNSMRTHDVQTDKHGKTYVTEMVVCHSDDDEDCDIVPYSKLPPVIELPPTPNPSPLALSSANTKLEDSESDSSSDEDTDDEDHDMLPNEASNSIFTFRAPVPKSAEPPAKKIKVPTPPSTGMQLIARELGMTSTSIVGMNQDRENDSMSMVVYDGSTKSSSKRNRSRGHIGRGNSKKDGLTPETAKGTKVVVERGTVRISILADFQQRGWIRTPHIIMAPRKTYYQFGIIRENAVIEMLAIIQHNEGKLGVMEFPQPKTYHNSTNAFLAAYASDWKERHVTKSGGGALYTRVCWLKHPYMESLSDFTMLRQYVENDTDRDKYWVMDGMFSKLYVSRINDQGNKSNIVRVDRIDPKTQKREAELRRALGCDMANPTSYTYEIEPEPGPLELCAEDYSTMQQNADAQMALQAINRDLPSATVSSEIVPTNGAFERRLTLIERFMTQQQAASSLVPQMIQALASVAGTMNRINNRLDKMEEEREADRQLIMRQIEVKDTNYMTGQTMTKTFPMPTVIDKFGKPVIQGNEPYTDIFGDLGFMGQ